MRNGLERIVVVGSSCSGKTTFARTLARILGAPHIEFDALHWLPRWQERPEAEFRALLDAATAPHHWVADGNYGIVRDLVWPRATHVVWLNYSFAVVWRQRRPAEAERFLRSLS